MAGDAPASAAELLDTSAPSVSAGEVLGPAHRRHRQARLAERSRRGSERRDTRRGGPLEDRRPRLPADRIDAGVPTQRVEQAAGAGNGHLVAEEPMLARRPARAERAKTGGRGGGETRGQRSGSHRQLGQEWRRRRVRAEQLPAQAVDEQQAHPLGLWQLQRIRLTGNCQRGEYRGRERIQAGLCVPWQRRLDGLGGHDLLDAPDKAWANASTCSTASAPSAASLIRIVTSSDVIAPV